MTRRNLILLMLIGLIAALALWRFVSAGRDAARLSADFPEGTLWLCTSPTCGVEFTRSVSDLAAFHADHPDDPLPCPTCGSTQTSRARRCPHCAAAFIPPATAPDHPPTCPKCHAPLPRLTTGPESAP